MTRFSKHFAVIGGIAFGIGLCAAGFGVAQFVSRPSGDVDGGDARPIDASQIAIRWFLSGCIAMGVGCCFGALAKHSAKGTHEDTPDT